MVGREHGEFGHAAELVGFDDGRCGAPGSFRLVQEAACFSCCSGSTLIQ
jgi:hypothetical protein